jgi:hypothetical protein
VVGSSDHSNETLNFIKRRGFRDQLGECQILQKNIGLGAFAASELDKVFSGYHDDDRDGHRNVGILRTSNAADSPRRLYQHLQKNSDP